MAIRPKWMGFLPLACVLFSMASCRDRNFQHLAAKVSDGGQTSDFGAWFSSLPYGPIPDYELTAMVVSHKVGGDLLPGFLDAMKSVGETQRLWRTNVGGERGSLDGGSSMVWMRDYHPLAIKSRDPAAGGKGRIVGYLSINPKRNSYTATRRPALGSTLLGAQAVAIDQEAIGSESDTISYLRMPIIVQGGNLVSSGSHLFMTDHVFLQNSPEFNKYLGFLGIPISQLALEQIYKENEFYVANPWGEKFEYRAPAQVRRTISKHLEILEANIVTLPSLPGEKTRHVDLYVMALGPKQLVIPEITDEGIGMLAFEQEKSLAYAARDFLNAQAHRLRSELGFQVDRLPMLPPVYQYDLQGQKMGVYFSPTNSLLANMGPDRRFVFFPHFDVPADWGEKFRSYSGRVETAWQSYFATQGWRPIPVTANKAAQANGLIRCLTAQVPFLSGAHMQRFLNLGY